MTKVVVFLWKSAHVFTMRPHISLGKRSKLTVTLGKYLPVNKILFVRYIFLKLNGHIVLGGKNPNNIPD